MDAREPWLKALIKFLPIDKQSEEAYTYHMTITQTVEIPADHRISLELPRSVPIGVKARVDINIPVKNSKNKSNSEIENIRHLLQKEMSEKGTFAVTTESGDGWEAHIKERYAESCNLNRAAERRRFPS